MGSVMSIIKDKTKEINTPKVPTAKEIYIALKVLLNKSFPALSVPNK